MFFRSSINESLFRALRSEFDRFPNIDYDESLDLGQIGFTTAKAAPSSGEPACPLLEFQRRYCPGGATPPIANTAYISGSASRCAFKLEASHLGTAEFAFPQNRSLATQALAIHSKRYDIGLLENALHQAIEAGMSWNREWVVVTQVYPAQAYTLLFSRTSNVEATISTGLPPPSATFNIADPKLALGLTKTSGALYNVLAKENVTPFFRVHKLKGWGGAGASVRPRLESYGRNGEA